MDCTIQRPADSLRCSVAILAMVDSDPITRMWWNGTHHVFAFSLSALAKRNSSITNKTWKNAAQQGGVDPSKISKHRRNAIVRAQFNLCDEIFGIDSGLTDEAGGGYAELQMRKKLLTEIFTQLGACLKKFETWESASDEEKTILMTAVQRGAEFQNDLKVATQRYLALALKTPKSKSAAKEKLFEIWVWQLATAFYEAGGSVIMTAPGSGGRDSYRSAFYLFALRMMRDELDWPLATKPEAFGAKLYRTLQNLRKIRKRKSGEDFVIIEKGKVLVFPT